MLLCDKDSIRLSTKLSNICCPHCQTPILSRNNKEIDQFHKIPLEIRLLCLYKYKVISKTYRDVHNPL